MHGLMKLIDQGLIGVVCSLQLVRNEFSIIAYTDSGHPG